MKRVILAIFFLFGLSGRAQGRGVSFVKSTDVYRRISAAIEAMHAFDGHEHFAPEKEMLAGGVPDFFDVVRAGSYAGDDNRCMDKSLSIKERWEAFLPVYNEHKNLGYMRSVSKGIEKIYGVKITDAESIKKINEKMKIVYKPGIYREVLHDAGKIDYVLIHSRWEHGFPAADYPDFFRGGRVIDKMLIFTEPKDIAELEQTYGVYIHSVEDIGKIYKKFVEESLASGVVGFKYSGAYLRTLDFTECSREKADQLLKKLLQFARREWTWASHEAFSISDGMELSSYCMHLMLKEIEASDLPIAFHTGILGARDVRRANPQLLIPLFKEYKHLNFDLFHSGFPYITEMVELAKSWPNVYVNFCWSQNLCPPVARRQLSELLDCAGNHKIIAYGGDSRNVENAIGDLEIAKENCAIVLTEKVLGGYFTEDKAIECARGILRENAVEVYKLEVAK